MKFSIDDVFDGISTVMNVVLNIIWFILGGFIIVAEYFLGGLILCATIIGIPFGLQCFKLGVAAMAPFGKEIESIDYPIGMGCLATICNIIWIFPCGLICAFTHLILGIIFWITIILAPLGSQHFKLMLLAFAPFGQKLVKS